MASKRIYYDTSKITTNQMGQVVDEIMSTISSQRKNFERRWYDNNFFDDGHHFRYLSRSQNKIVDLSDRSTLYAPMRAIPKSSRQIRGVANLLVSRDLTPVVYPEKVNQMAFPDEQLYKMAVEESKRVAKLEGHWLEEEFRQQDIKSKLMQMVVLAAKNSVSYLHIFPDSEREKIRTVVRDAFDVYLLGNNTDIEDVPAIIIGYPKTVSEIKANEAFDPEQLAKINPDNRHASSEIKEAYMKSRYGREQNDDTQATIILKEAIIKEHLNANNRERIRSQENGKDILGNKKEGDVVYRQAFVAGNIELLDTYLDIPSYPLVPFTFEPGPLYQVPLIERLMPSNKSLDAIVSRIERHAHTMTVGAWIKRQGEQFDISNAAGGQIIEYDSVPPQQAQVAPLPAHLFNFIGLLNSFIEEQGVSTSTLAKLPPGIKAAKAIESLKESEFANLVIANEMYKKTIQQIAEKMLDLADRYFVTPQTVALLEKGEPQYFDIIGKTALDKRKQLKVPPGEDVIPVSKEHKVEIEIQNGLGYTREGQKAAAKELGDYMIQLGQLGMLPPEAITGFVRKLLETYEFGPTEDVMEPLEKYMQEGQLTDQQMDKIKVAIAEVLKDVGYGQDTAEEDIQKTKIGVAEALQDIAG